MTAQIKAFPYAGRRQEQVEANLERIELALRYAPLNLVVDRGTTDEGDPWLVFCDPRTKDVIAHVAVLEGEVVADSRVFAKPFRSRDIGAAIRELLRSFQIDRAGLGGNAIIAISVAIAYLHLSDADAAKFAPLDQEDLLLPSLLATGIPATAIAEMLMKVQELASEAVQLLVTSPDETSVIILDEDSLCLDVPDHQPVGTSSILPRLMGTVEEIAIAAPKHIAIALGGTIDFEADIHSPLAGAVLQNVTALRDSLPLDTGRVEPERIHDFEPDQLSEALLEFRDSADSYELYIEGGVVSMLGYGIEGYVEYAMEDGSYVVLIGSESAAYQQIFA